MTEDLLDECEIVEIEEMHLQWTAAESIASIIEQSMRTEFQSWCNANCDQPVDYKAVVRAIDPEGTVIHRYVFFHQTSDAILFKLTWGGKYSNGY